MYWRRAHPRGVVGMGLARRRGADIPFAVSGLALITPPTLPSPLAPLTPLAPGFSPNPQAVHCLDE